MNALSKIIHWLKNHRLYSLYFCATHLLLVALIFVPNFAAKISKKVGKEHPNENVNYSYQSMKTMLSRVDQNLGRNTTLFIGDSITQGLAVNQITPYAANFGIGHDTIEGVTMRLKSYQSLNKVSLVIIAVGTNDLRQMSVKSALRKYKVLMENINQINSVFIHEVLPIDAKILGYELQSKITKFNQQLFKLSKEFDNIDFLQSSNDFFNSNGDLNTYLHIGDGLHLNKQGYSVWIKQLQKQINNQ